jgi:hypothetical protein
MVQLGHCFFLLGRAPIRTGDTADLSGPPQDLFEVAQILHFRDDAENVVRLKATSTQASRYPHFVLTDQRRGLVAAFSFPLVDRAVPRPGRARFDRPIIAQDGGQSHELFDLSFFHFKIPLV